MSYCFWDCVLIFACACVSFYVCVCLFGYLCVCARICAHCSRLRSAQGAGKGHGAAPASVRIEAPPTVIINERDWSKWTGNAEVLIGSRAGAPPSPPHPASRPQVERLRRQPSGLWFPRLLSAGVSVCGCVVGGGGLEATKLDWDADVCECEAHECIGETLGGREQVIWQPEGSPV